VPVEFSMEKWMHQRQPNAFLTSRPDVRLRGRGSRPAVRASCTVLRCSAVLCSAALAFRAPLPRCERDRASPKKSNAKTLLNRKTLYRESQKIPIPHPRLVSPIKLGLALNCEPRFLGTSAHRVAKRVCGTRGAQFPHWTTGAPFP
jgi:hypothetical protein